MNKFLSVFLVLAVIFLLIIPSIWCYNPSSLVNLKYKTNIPIETFKDPTIFISSIDPDYHDLEQIVLCTEATKTYKKLNIVSKKSKSFFYRNAKTLPLFPTYNLMYTGDKIVDKSIEKITRSKENLLIFLDKNWKNKGIYHILKDRKIPIVFVKLKIKEKMNREEEGIFYHIKKYLNQTYKVEYNLVEDYSTDMEPEKFMSWIKSNLYDD